MQTITLSLPDIAVEIDATNPDRFKESPATYDESLPFLIVFVSREIINLILVLFCFIFKSTDVLSRMRIQVMIFGWDLRNVISRIIQIATI